MIDTKRALIVLAFYLLMFFLLIYGAVSLIADVL